MRQGRTSNGFEYSLDEQVFNDMELLELMSELEKNPLVYAQITERILGKEGKKELYEFCRTKDGRVPIDAVEATLAEIMKGNDEGKN